MKHITILLLTITILFNLSACDTNNISSTDATSTPTQSVTESKVETDINSESKTNSEIADSSTTSVEESVSSEPVESSKPTESSEPTHTHEFSNATCTSPETCSCGVTNGNELGHSYLSNGRCSVCDAQIEIKNILMSDSSINLKKNESYNLSITYEPDFVFDNQISWYSSDENVASVSQDGTVTAKNFGNATITANTNDGISASCLVTISKMPLTVEASIGISMLATNSFVGQGVFAEAIVTGGSEEYVEYNIKLYRDGELIGENTENEIFVTPALKGEYTAEIYVKDSDGNEATTTQNTTIG